MSAMEGLHVWDWVGISEKGFREKAKAIQDTARENKDDGSCVKCGRELKYSRWGYTLCRWCRAKYRKWVRGSLLKEEVKCRDP